MKKLFVFAALSALFAGCSDNTAENAVRKFTVGFDADFPPYGYKEGAEYKGFDLDLAREVCARKGWEFVAKPINWDAKDMELNSGLIDCIWNGFTMQGREDKYTWTVPYIDNSQVVLVKVASPVQTLADLKGKVVGVQTDTPVQKALQKGGDKEALGATFKQLMIVPNYNVAVFNLESGAVDAVAVDIGVAKKKMNDMPGKFRMLGEIVMTETYGVGFKQGNTALKDEVEAMMQELADDGTMKILAGKYGIEENALILWKK